MPNVALAGPIPLSPFRHIALGTWRTAYDPSIYGSATIRMDEAERYVEPRVVDGRLTVGKVMRLYATFDHRVVDGAHAARAVAIAREWLEHPLDHFDTIEPHGFSGRAMLGG